MASLKISFVATIALFTIVNPGGSLVAQDFDVNALQSEIFSTIEQVSPAVASIRTKGGGGMFSGVVVSKDGKVLSAGHAVSPGTRYEIFLPGRRKLEGVGKGSNGRADCALIQITSEFDELPYVQMGDSDALVRHQPVLSLAFPGGQLARSKPLVRFGRVTNTRTYNGMVQTTALMEPGDSGGPLFDLDGRVIGIHSRIGASMTNNFDIPVNTFKSFWNELNREERFTSSGPPTPKLGINGSPDRNSTGVRLIRVYPDTLADEHGLMVGDVVQQVHGKKIETIQSIIAALEEARDDGSEELIVLLDREEAEVEITIPFEVERKGAPEIKLPDYKEQEFEEPVAMRELIKLQAQFVELESLLDDACIAITSKLGEVEEQQLVATLVKGTNFLVSKSSMVGENPKAKFDEEADAEELEIIARDNANDLVLMKCSLTHESGIELDQDFQSDERVGRFLLTPEADGDGVMSIWSTNVFRSNKDTSRGFLGVRPQDAPGNGGAKLIQVDDGAAKNAGLKANDVIIQLNDSKIKNQADLRKFLQSVNPKEAVEAKFIRGEEILNRTITLGTVPTQSRHAADMMKKSLRRDGFTKVISHDA
ncbi:MAG: PDZ domain-containing protein, partial [Planctomycetota bacterium]